MTTNRIVNVGVLQTPFTAKGMEEYLSGQNGFFCAWATDEDPREQLKSNPVDLFIAYHGNEQIGEILQALKGMKKRPYVVITASSMLRCEAAERLRDLGVKSFLHIPTKKSEVPAFLDALKEIADGTQLADLRVISSDTVNELRIRNRRRHITAAPRTFRFTGGLHFASV